MGRSAEVLWRAAAALLVAFAPVSCWKGEDKPQAQRDSAARDARGLVDIAAVSGLSAPTRGGTPEKLSILENIGSGSGLLDADGDSRLDVLILSGGGRTGSRLEPDFAVRFYLQGRNGEFLDETKRWGLAFPAWGTGVAVGDVDNDGDPDLLITCYGQDRFFRNIDHERFEDATEQAGFLIDDAGTDLSTSAVFFDYDADGLLDVYVARYVALDLAHPPNAGRPCLTGGVAVACAPHLHDPLPDRFYHNRGDRFEEVSRTVGLHRVEGAYGLGVAAGDLDGDGRTDVYVANDTTANFLWRNVDGERFVEDALFAGCALDDEGRGQAGMGVTLADLNGDEALDIVVTNYSQESNALYYNLKDGTFESAAHEAALREPSYLLLGWGVAACDWNLDGYLDLAIANGHVYPRAREINSALSYLQPCLFLRGTQSRRFVDDGRALGVSVPRAHRALARGDLEGDGDVDFLLSVLDGPPVLLRNDMAVSGAWLSLELEGTRTNRDAIGARVWLEVAGRTQFREVTRGGSYLASHDPRLLFGLGTAEQADALRVAWPGGDEEAFGPLPARRSYRVVEGAGRVVVVEPRR